MLQTHLTMRGPAAQLARAKAVLENPGGFEQLQPPPATLFDLPLTEQVRDALAVLRGMPPEEALSLEVPVYLPGGEVLGGEEWVEEVRRRVAAHGHATRREWGRAHYGGYPYYVQIRQQEGGTLRLTFESLDGPVTGGLRLLAEACPALDIEACWQDADQAGPELGRLHIPATRKDH